MIDLPVIHWGAERLQQQLAPWLPDLSVEVVHRTSSTNTTLLERARATANGPVDEADAQMLARMPEQTYARAHVQAQVQVRRSVESGAFGRRAVDLQPCLLIAEHQSAGRGRQGRMWQSIAGASLTFSLGLPLTVPDWSGLSLAVGVAIADALDVTAVDAPSPHIGLKWPNDLWLMDGPLASAPRGRKLGGVLIETVAAGHRRGGAVNEPANDPARSKRLVIVGIGLNVLPFDTVEANTGFASLSELDPALSAPDALARIALPLVNALQRFERDGFAAFAERFAARDLLRGRTVRTTLPEVPEGVARGVSAQGALRVQSTAGLVNVTSGEVSVRLAAGV